jgi:serine/threonine protein kinase
VAVLRRVSDDTPRPIRAVNPDIPEWLEAVISKLHAKDPAERFQSAAEVADFLSRCLAHVQEPLTVPLPTDVVVKSACSDGRRFNRLWWCVRAALLCLLPVIAGVVVWIWPRPRASDVTERSHAQSQQLLPSTPVMANPARQPPDEIEREIADAWAKAQTVDSELHRSSDCQVSDRVSALARALADRTARLKQEILSGRGAKP